jgi:hypothetical protein
VFIYRLLCTGTLEEKMYQRQIAKGELSCAVEISNHHQSGRGTVGNKKDDDDDDDANDDANANDNNDVDDVRHFEQEDIRDLFRFRSDVATCDTLHCMRGRWLPTGTARALESDKVLHAAVNATNRLVLNGGVSYVHLNE